jgi:hypothetical protein
MTRQSTTMIDKDALIGTRVQIVIEEDGTPNPPTLPRGTITRKVLGTDRINYYLVHLDHPVTTLRARTNENWVLRDLVVAPKFQGGSLALLLHSDTNSILVGIANILKALDQDDPLLDFSSVAYFATGKVKRST